MMVMLGLPNTIKPCVLLLLLGLFLSLYDPHDEESSSSGFVGSMPNNPIRKKKSFCMYCVFVCEKKPYWQFCLFDYRFFVFIENEKNTFKFSNPNLMYD